MTETLGQAIRKLRKEEGLSLIQVQEKSGISNSFLSQLERGERGAKNASIETLSKLAKALGVSKLYLFRKAGYLDETDILELVDENKRLREALAFYANPITYKQMSVEEPPDIWSDGGEIARQALGGETN